MGPCAGERERPQRQQWRWQRGGGAAGGRLGAQVCAQQGPLHVQPRQPHQGRALPHCAGYCPGIPTGACAHALAHVHELGLLSEAACLVRVRMAMRVLIAQGTECRLPTGCRQALHVVHQRSCRRGRRVCVKHLNVCVCMRVFHCGCAGGGWVPAGPHGRAGQVCAGRVLWGARGVRGGRHARVHRPGAWATRVESAQRTSLSVPFCHNRHRCCRSCLNGVAMIMLLPACNPCTNTCCVCMCVCVCVCACVRACVRVCVCLKRNAIGPAQRACLISLVPRPSPTPSRRFVPHKRYSPLLCLLLM